MRCVAGLVDSDADLLRARHGGRHEGGGRRQRKRDEKLVHLGCTLASLNAGLRRVEMVIVSKSKLESPSKRHDSRLDSNSKPLRVHLRQSELQIWESAGRAEPRDHKRRPSRHRRVASVRAQDP